MSTGRRVIGYGDTVWGHAVAATDEARSLGSSLAEVHLDKGRLHTWLAWQEPPGLPFGTALTAKLLGHDAEVARAFVAWARRVFE